MSLEKTAPQRDFLVFAISLVPDWDYLADTLRWISGNNSDNWHAADYYIASHNLDQSVAIPNTNPPQYMSMENACFLGMLRMQRQNADAQHNMVVCHSHNADRFWQVAAATHGASPP